MEAYTLDANGVRHDVASSQIDDLQKSRPEGAPMFFDEKLRLVIFPAVTVGWTVHLHYRMIQSEAVVPGEFDDFTVPGQQPVLKQQLKYDLPADKPLYADARGYVRELPVTANRRTRYVFDYRRENLVRAEQGSVGRAQYDDCLIVSTFPDYASFAASYREAAVDATANDPAIQGTRAPTDPQRSGRTRKGEDAV
ncbi:DUF3857 domain-containing protein [Caballeronia sp. LZ043]|nr:DUF3857 domain-containing protein [Caballeronia sp. LZ043]